MVEVEYLIPEKTQSVWRHHNRYGFRDLAIKLGRRVVYDRADIDAWLEVAQRSRRGVGMSAVVQLVDSADQRPQSKAERAREAATAAWQNHREYEAALEALKADASRLRKACSDAEETQVARAEQKVTAEAAIEPARLAIGAAANEGRDTQPLFEDLRSKEAAAYLAKYQHAAAIRDAQKAVADRGTERWGRKPLRIKDRIGLETGDRLRESGLLPDPCRGGRALFSNAR